ncbi:hypothetical protein VTO42DRAFT_6429 [Malbranchea cinnamomea]
MDHAQRGARALGASDFPRAIHEYTRALIVNPHAPDYYIKRSTAYTRLKPADGGPNLESALRDAEMAVVLAIQRARREQILAGQMRRGVVLYQMGRYADAEYIFGLVRAKAGKTPSRATADAMAAGGMDRENTQRSKEASIRQELDIWEIKVKTALGKLDSGDDRTKVSVKETPDIKVPDQDALKKEYQRQLQQMTGSDGSDAKTATASQPGDDASDEKGKNLATEAAKSQSVEDQSVLKPEAQAPAPSKVRHEWYQSADTVVVTLYAKGVPRDKADIEITENSVSISFPLSTGLDFSFTLDPLYAPVDVSSSKSSILSTKIEIVLRKKHLGQKWASLEGAAHLPPEERSVAPATISSTSKTPSSSTSKAPAYPTSSRKGVKDWDKLASSLTKKTKKKEDGMEADDDSDLSEYGGDPVDAFFKKLYANADPDTRRAMVKSYYESQGTALSTNWSEVSKKKVEPHLPSDD